MASATAGIELLTVPEIGIESGAPDWAVRKTLDLMGIAKRVGRHRVIERGDLPLVIEELAQRGYLNQPATGREPGAVASPNGQGPAGYHPGEALNCPRAAHHSGVLERPDLEEPEAVRAINFTPR